MRTSSRAAAAIAACVAILGVTTSCDDPAPPAKAAPLEAIALPEPTRTGTMSVEDALSRRRSRREFAAEAPGLEDVAQVLWAAQGITDDKGHRTAPSAGARYPLELYLTCGDIDGLAAGLYRYRAAGHALDRLRSQDTRDAVVAAAGQDWLADAPILLVIAAVYDRTRERYGEKGERHVHVEVGHVAQNIYLQAEARGLATVMAGGFDDDALAAAIGLATGERPLAIMPLGRAARSD